MKIKTCLNMLYSVPLKKVTTNIKAVIVFVLLTSPVLCFGQWEKVTTHPSFSFSPFHFIINGNVYIGSEQKEGNEDKPMTFYKYYPVENIWQSQAIPPFAPKRSSFSFSIGEYGYVGAGGQPYGTTVYNDFWRFDPSANKWEKMADFPGFRRKNATSFVVNGKGYVIGGYDGSNRMLDCWEYDPVTNSWKEMSSPSLLYPSNTIGFSHDGYGYVGIGGGLFEKYNDFWRFDPVGNSWKQLASLPAPSGARFQAVGGKNLIYGKGYVGLGFEGFKDFWMYDFANDAWSTTTSEYNFPLALYGASTFSVNDNIYVGFGFDAGNNYKNNHDVYKFNFCKTFTPDLNSGLIAYYPFNSGSINDFSGNNHHLTNVNGVVFTKDKSGNASCAAEFDNIPASQNQFLTTPNTAFLDGLSEFSISCWYKPLNETRKVGDYEALVNRDLGLRCPDRLGQWALGLYDCRGVVFGRESSVRGDGCGDNPTDKWNHVTATYNKTGNVVKLYANGVLKEVASGRVQCGFQDYATSRDIGDLFIGKMFTGVIDEIYIHNREISPCEVTALFNKEITCGVSTITKENVNSPLHIYPNPSSRYFTTSLNTNELGGFLEVYSITGVNLLSINSYQGTPVDVSLWNSGLYIVQYEKDTKVRFAKFLKQ